jgi:hypothetical protein
MKLQSRETTCKPDSNHLPAMQSIALPSQSAITLAAVNEY